MNNIEILIVHRDALVETLKNLRIHDFSRDDIYDYAVKIESLAKLILKKTKKGIIVNAKTLDIREGSSSECLQDEIHIKPISKLNYNYLKYTMTKRRNHA